jgi:hypothetical protein
MVWVLTFPAARKLIAETEIKARPSKSGRVGHPEKQMLGKKQTLVHREQRAGTTLSAVTKC